MSDHIRTTPAAWQPPSLIDDTHDKELGAGFSYLWASGCFSDFTIAVDDSEFRAHKAVLSIHSPVFTAMFMSEKQEQLTGMEKIQDYSAKVVEQFLAYMYTGRLKDKSQVMNIFALAAMYDVPKLKSMSEEIIKWNVNTANAYQVFLLGHLHSSRTLKEAAFEVIKGMFPGKQLPDKLMENPESIQELIEAREDLNIKVKAATKYRRDAEMHFEQVCKKNNVQSVVNPF